MMNLTFKRLKLRAFSMRALIMFGLLSCPVVLFAKGNKWNATYTVNINASQSTGSGTIYVMADVYADSQKRGTYVSQGNKSGETVLFNPNNVKPVSLVQNYTVGGSGTNVTYVNSKFENITLCPAASEGSYFDGWTTNRDNKGNLMVKATYEFKQTDQSDAVDISYTDATTYYPVFIARTFYAYNQPSDYEVITIDQAGNIINDDLTVTATPSFQLVTRGPDGITIGKRTTVNANVFSQLADNQGQIRQASYIWDITTPAAPCHTYYGWKTSSGNYNNATTNNACGVTTTSEDSNNPAQHKVYVVYKRDPFNLMEYDADNQITAALAMPYSMENGIQQYSENISGAELGTKYYRIVLGTTGEVTVTSDGDFSASLGTDVGKQILIVTPNDDNAQEGTIYISVGGTQIAELHLTVNVKPVYVTLNPAEDLTGTYTYTQSTTGTQVFSVTTSPVVKQLITATDYSFSFIPTPLDATKYQFDRWIIQDADGNIVAEPVEPNLTYTFKGDESITPVFTAIDRAVFIVKSEPNVKYVDLQKALDRAAALGSGQVVVVTVEGNRKGGRLVQGEYVIRNGVTLLVPGESSYTPMVGKITTDDLSESGSSTPFCTLKVEDNTKITVEDGNISVYAKIKCQPTNGSILSPGHIQLGKNCEITVKKGNLCSYGFITGDNSSHIIMESGTTAYEAFQFADWRGGDETNSMKDNNYKVFPVGQYYIQGIEVPITFEYGSKEILATGIQVSVVGKIEANVNIIDTYSADLCLFGIDDGATVTKMYDPTTDRIKFIFEGDKNSSSKPKVKLGHLQLNMKAWGAFGVDMDSKNFVMPLQNNMDVEVKNAIIDVTSDMAFLPGSLMRVYDDAVINIGAENNTGVNMYIYDRGARKLNDGSGYWGSGNSIIKPLGSTARPGKIKTPARSEVDLVDARLIVNGSMNIYGSLYTVKGAFAGEDTEEPEGGADITSEGSGKIYVYKIGGNTVTYQWKQGANQQSLALTTPNLLLHNDVTKQPADNKYAYTEVKKPDDKTLDEYNAILKNAPLEYTYYQHDGTWRLPEAGITGIKLYDAEDNEITNFYVTLPNANVTGYLLATLQPMANVTYELSDFNIQLSAGNIATNGEATITTDGKLRIPVKYNVQNKHGEYSQTLTITHSTSAEFVCGITQSIKVVEDYTPVFTASAALNIYGRVGADNPAALPIQPAEKNVTTLSEADEVSIEWTANITGGNSNQFAFEFGEGVGNMLSGARVIFRPTTAGQKKAALTLTATYTDENSPEMVLQKVHTVTLVGNAMKNANTLEFNNVGTITVNTEPFDLLKGINSPEQITVTTEQVGTDIPSDIADITPVDASQPNTNYTFTPKAVGQLKVKVSQASSNAYEGKTNPVLEKIFMVVANPRPLTEVSCASTETDFRLLTANMSNVAYDNAQIQFASTEAPAVWSAQFASMPGTLTFIPHGGGHWAIQESKDGKAWSEMMWWTQLPNSEEVTIPLTPSSRYLQIQYIKSDDEDYGYITDLCINPFSIHAETTKLYVPVEGGVVRSTSVVFTHVAEPANIQIVGPAGWTVTTNPSGNIGGLKNPYYQTTVTLSGGQNVVELNNGFTLIATQTTDNTTATVTLATFNFPKPLPMQSAQWKSDDNVDNVNGYDEAEYYHLYLHDSEYAKWDAASQTVVFMNKGSHITTDRQVAFGYYGLPNEVRFESLSTDWQIDEGEETTEGVEWTPTNTGVRTITTNNGVSTITQPINHTSKFVRITYIGTEPNEITIQNVVIEGFPSATAPAEVEIAKTNDLSTPSATFNIHVMNLPRMKMVLDNTSEFRLWHGDASNWILLTSDDGIISTEDYPTKMKMNEEGDITIKVEWIGSNVVNEGYIQILNPDDSNKVLATVRLVGKKDGITAADANTGIWTGVPDGLTTGRPTADKYTLEGTIFEPYTYHEVNVQNAFDADGKALFNYMVIYGETTTTDNTKIITTPKGTSGSNAKTPYYIYERADDGMSYRFVQAVENANSAQKANLSGISHFNVVKEESGVKYYAIKPTPGEPLSFYMTGFCPYATTGSSKDDEGVWYFQGEVGDQLHIYLEDCHLYSRNKSATGQPTAKNDDASPDFTEDYVKGSGAVLVFENANPRQDSQESFYVSIHTRNHNLLKSNYGCYYTFIGTLQATQISSPVQVRLGAYEHFKTARTTLNFDDVWPTSIDKREFDEHTNGFLSLKKQSNNAPSIDLGNANTVVNFRGGQIQLQNAQVVSPNYKTTLAISYRSGLMGNVNIPMAYGIGTDEVGGTVNFYDGTTTVVPMTVQEEYREFYLMDQVQAKNEDGTPKVDAEGNPVMVDGTTTTCLRTPTNTYVYGGSHCMMRACNHVTSKGGAPKDGPTGVLLGRYVYNNTNPEQGYTYRCVVDELPTGDLSIYQAGYELVYQNNRYVVDLTNNEWDLIGPAPFTDPCYIVTPTNFPGNLQYKGSSLATYYQSYPDGEYGLNSITPDKDGNLSFWIPEGVVEGVEPETDKQLSAWKACMTEIQAGAFEVTGRIGGPTSVEFNEEVKNLLYCQLDQNIYNVISEHTVKEENGEEVRTYKYQAPVVDPTGMLPANERYMSIAPLLVGDSVQHSIVSKDDYIVTNKIYYVTTAMADTWMNFTMPFNVEKIWVVEPYSEAKIEEYFANPTDKKTGESNLDATMRYQARHNADFAAFFGVAMAIGDNSKTFEDIYNGYIDWAKNKADKDNGLYSSGTYDLRGKYPLTHYNGTNFTTSNFYLYKNTQDWTIQDADNSQFTTHWQLVPEVAEGGVLMEKGATYSMLFPYCLGCDIELDENNQIVVDEDGFPILNERDYWDYWSGKFLIFESTKASEKNPHVIKGSDYVESNKVDDAEWIFDSHPTDATKAVLTGNTTFAMLNLDGYAKVQSVYSYVANRQTENFYPIEPNGEGVYPVITPTASILLNGNSTRAKMITREGRIIYDKENTPTDNQGGNIPTVGGGNDLFITSTVEGINIAVAEPQHVRVLSSTGAVLYSGMVQTAVDVALPTTGVYVITGENEVHKILH